MTNELDVSQRGISVVIPVFRQLAELRRCLACLEQAKAVGAPVEIIVVNNDPDSEISPHLGDHGHVRVVRETTPGSYAARNRGIAESRGAFVAFTDADCEPDPSWLSEALATLEAQDQLGAVTGRMILTEKASGPPSKAHLYDTVFGFRHIAGCRDGDRVPYGVTANLVVARTSGDAVGWFRADLFSGGDKDLTRRLKQNGFPVRFAERAIVYHPTRDDLAALETKQRRIVGGRVADLQHRRGRMPGTSVYRQLITQAIADLRTALTTPRIGSLGQRWSVVTVVLRLLKVALHEVRHLRQGGEGTRT